MTYYFMDSSALTKRYLVEAGTHWIRALTLRKAANSILIAQITPAELVSAAMRRVRAGAFSLRTAHTIRLMVDRHVQREYIAVGLNAAIIDRAETLLETQNLRAYDAVQLASAIEANQRLLEAVSASLTFVCAD